MTFKKGKSGNVNGRPIGSGQSGKIRALLASKSEDLVNKALELAASGDTQALKLCLERVCPPLKTKDELVAIGTLDGDLIKKAEKVIRVMGTGQLTPGEAHTVMQTIATQAKIIEINEMEKRLTALEASHDHKN